MSKMDIWNAVARPPAGALKKITGGRLNGMTDISPQWRLKIMTEQFGPVGQGWGYNIERLWTEPGSDGQVCAFAQVSVWYDGCGQPTPGIGGSMLIANESKGAYTSDEAYKMAVTDALSVAFKALGVAADIYMGMWDGSKYKDDRETSVPDGKAAALYTECVGLINENIPSEEVETFEKAMKWLNDHLKTVGGMTAAKKKLQERFNSQVEDAFNRADAELKEVGI